ncbi:hypothetical protein BJ944DRAFT_162183 [Cunninghamella echinulata]|nr:hypothetical protein BJ944DRAFT_162183 [Cunninghamella echinulata]
MQLQLEKLQHHIEQLSQIQQQQKIHTYQINNQSSSFSNHSLINTLPGSGNDGNALPLHYPPTHQQHHHQQQRSGVVILSNLDQQATPHDVQIVCSKFGFVTRCDMMYDSQGISCGEAEIEFADINAACEFIQQFDKQMVDNKVVSAVLRQDRVQSSVKSVITPTRSGYRTK